MLSSKTLKEIVSEARPIIERQLDDAEMIAGLRDVVANAGGDWSALKALIKAQIQDERDETGNGKRVKKILDKAGFSTDYASMLGWSNMNEKNFSADEDFDPITGEFVDREKAIREKGLAGALSAALGIEVEIVRTNPVANVEEGATGAIAAASSDPAGRTDEDSERQHSSTVGFTDDCRTGGKEQSDASAAPVGEADARSLPATNSPSDDDAIAEVNGSAGLANVVDVEPSSSDPIDVASQGEATDLEQHGGDDVDGSAVRADTSNTAGGTVSNPPAKPLRPHCLRPENCGGYGSNHCFACKRAAKAHEHEEEAA